MLIIKGQKTKSIVIVLLLLILLVGLKWRVEYYIQANLPSDPVHLKDVIPDENTYYTQAELITQMGLIPYLMTEESMTVATINPLYLSMFLKSDNPIIIARTTNIFLSVLTLLLVYWLGYLVFSSHFVGILGSFFIAYYQSFIKMSPTILTEPLFFFIFLLSLNVLILSYKRQSRFMFALSGFLFAIVTLTRPVMQIYPYYLFFCCCVLFYLRKVPKDIIINCTIFTLIFTLIIGPMAIKNMILFEKFGLFNGTGAVLYIGSRADTEGDEPPYRGKGYEVEKVIGNRSHLSIEGDRLLIKAAIKNIKEHPLGYIYWGIKKIGRITIGNIYYWGTNRWPIYAVWKPLIYQISIVILALFSFVYYSSKNKTAWIIFLTAIYWVFIHTPFLVNTRYGYPIFPLWSVFASALIYEYLDKNFYKRSNIVYYQVLPAGIILFVFLYLSFGYKLFL